MVRHILTRSFSDILRRVPQAMERLFVLRTPKTLLDEFNYLPNPDSINYTPQCDAPAAVELEDTLELVCKNN